MTGIIGIGNILRGDDGIGIIILLRLQDIFRGNPGFELINYGTADLNLLSVIENYTSVLLIDAFDAGLEPGKMMIFRLEEGDYKDPGGNFSTHALTPGGIFQLYKGLGIKTPVNIAGIQVGDLPYAGEISMGLNSRLDSIVDEIKDYLLKNNSPQIPDADIITGGL
jgi:hydrogenase maturation protease